MTFLKNFRKRYAYSCLVMLAAVLSLQAVAQSADFDRKNINTAPYPYGNPVIRHMYTADASPHVMPDGQVWMVTSTDSDKGGGYETMHEYHTFSSGDMVHWTDHGQIINIDDLRPKGSDPKDKWALWAPDMIYRNGMYYLYFPVRILHSEETGAAAQRKHADDDGAKVKGTVSSYIAVAVSDNPGHRFKVVNPQLKGTKGIDPAIFIDDDGQAYLYWGSHMAAKLTSDMTDLAGPPVKLELGTDRFMEASWMDKHDGRYYFSYHTKYTGGKITKDNVNDPARVRSELAYSVGDSPLGPFKYGGILNYELGVNVKNGPRSPDGDFVPWRLTQSNHGGIVEFHGQEYLFYHTSALSSWRQNAFKGPGTWSQRSVCIDKLNYRSDGSIIPVQQTIEGVPAVTVHQSYNISLSVAAAALSSDAAKTGDQITVKGKSASIKFRDIDLGSGYYYFGLRFNAGANPFRAEVHLDRPDGPLVGTALTDANSSLNCCHAETFLRDAMGKHDLVIVVEREDGRAGSLDISDLRLFAGAPSPHP